MLHDFAVAVSTVIIAVGAAIGAGADGLSAAIGGLFGYPTAPAPQQDIEQPASTQFAAAGATAQSSPPPNPLLFPQLPSIGATSTVVTENVTNNPVVERIIERQTPAAFTGPTLNDLALLEARVNAKFTALLSPSAFPQQVAAAGVPGPFPMPPPAACRIDQLDGVTIRNATIVGGNISGTSGIGSGGIGSEATTTSFFSNVGHFTTGFIDALSSAAGTINALTSNTIVAVNASTTNLTVSATTTTNGLRVAALDCSSMESVSHTTIETRDFTTPFPCTRYAKSVHCPTDRRRLILWRTYARRCASAVEENNGQA